MKTSNIISIEPSKLDLSLAHLRQCPQSAIKAMISSLEKRGQLNPVIAAQEDKRMILVDGFKRHQAARTIGMKNIFVHILPLSGPNMKAYLYLLNKNNGFSFIEECLLIHELVEKDRLPQKDAAIMLERHESWVSRRLDIYRHLVPEVIEDIRTGLLPAGSGQSLARLPQGNQVDIAAAIARDGLQVKEAKRLVDLWCKADSPEARRFVVGSSRKALELSQINSNEKIDPRIPANARGWFKAVCRLKQSAMNLKQKSENSLGAMPPESESILCKTFEETRKLCLESIAFAYEILPQKEENPNEQA